MADKMMRLPSGLFKEDKKERKNNSNKPENNNTNDVSIKDILIKWQLVAFFGMLAVGFFVSIMLIPIRPSVSVTEKRELAKFPSFSFTALAQGQYFRDIETWFSDTFPARDFCVSINAVLKNTRGIKLNSTDIHGEIQQGDEIPSEVFTPAVESEPEIVASEPEPVSSFPPEKDVTGLDTQALDAIIIVDDSAYEYYSFDEKVAQKYISSVVTAASNLSEKNTYCMVIPTSIDIILPQSMRENLKTTDQKKAIDYMYGSMGEAVNTIPVYDALKSHCDEYIYFRTDHHWTALGAYYAYGELCKMNQWIQRPIEEYSTRTFDDFIGTFYADSGKNPALKKNPDVILAYEPPVNTDFSFTDKDGNTYKWDVIYDVTEWNNAAKYSTFVGGDNPYSLITNNDAMTEESCVVIKDSFANALIPFLVENYMTVHIIDFRYWEGKIYDFIRENEIDDVYFVNNISMTRNKSLVNSLAEIV